MNVEQSTPARSVHLARNRWIVHLALIIGFLATVGTAIELSKRYFGFSGTTDHAIVGLVVLALVLVHLWQRRHTVARLWSQCFTSAAPTTRKKMAIADLILWLLLLNVMVSGMADFVVGHTIFLPIPGPSIVQKWHGFGALVLLVYVTVHVVRRRTRLRRSRIS
jgi:hypothetical protein